MSRFFPHTPYAEDQPLAYTILTVHVLVRAVTTGTILGTAIAGTRYAIIPAIRRSPAIPGPPLPERLLLSASRGTCIAVGVTAVGLVGRMWGRELIEWQDRSWRLLENRGQVETDDWTLAGMGAASAVVLARGRRAGPSSLGWRGVVGALGIGSVTGMVGYLGWRYGINEGKFVEKDKKGEHKGI